MMSWPLRYRLMSFAITIGVTLTEFALVVIPLGIIVWLSGMASTAHIVEVAVALAAAFSLTIAISAHVWPQRHQRLQPQGVK
jgi:hypothetical protein